MFRKDCTPLLVAARAIIHARDYNAEHGRYPEGTLDAEQGFDDWAAELLGIVIDAHFPPTLTNEGRDYPSTHAEHSIKRAALRVANAIASASSVEEVLARENRLLYLLTLYGLLSFEEYVDFDVLQTDGITDENGHTHHHVYVYLKSDCAIPVLDITCDKPL